MAWFTRKLLPILLSFFALVVVAPPVSAAIEDGVSAAVQVHGDQHADCTGQHAPHATSCCSLVTVVEPCGASWALDHRRKADFVLQSSFAGVATYHPSKHFRPPRAS
ncbi:hypothetical protein ACFSX5_15400 [Devosia albogilva]|uniref:Uncharacterized protein n=1 Tax=Devosia albogilva TaxID=429726 RepID=A0ABW5QN78_9HYPH